MSGATLKSDVAAAERKGSRRERLQREFEGAVDAVFVGSVASWVFGAMRIGIALIFLVRHADWLRPWVYLEHHRFVHGLMFSDTSAREPRLHAPAIPGLTLGDDTTHVLIALRTILAVLLLLGVRARTSAALLALVSYTLFAADRFRYYHHLHLLYVMLAWLALAPIGATFSLENVIRRGVANFRAGAGALKPRAALDATSPLWSLQLLRALALSVYVAAAVSKLDASFLRGDALHQLEDAWILKGRSWEHLRDAVGFSGVAVLSCAAELAIPLGLSFARTRRLAVLGGWAFHALLSLSMPVYSFGAQMAVLLFAFWPRTTAAGGEPK